MPRDGEHWFSIYLPQLTRAQVRALVRKAKKRSLSDLMRAALALYDALLTDALAGRRIFIEDPETGKVVELPILPGSGSMFDSSPGGAP